MKGRMAELKDKKKERVKQMCGSKNSSLCRGGGGGASTLQGGGDNDRDRRRRGKII